MATTATQQAKLEVALSSIQPLRDLARNWDVDIASCLDDYLEEIVGQLSAETSETGEQAANNPSDLSSTSFAPNFAQAALLLHNSSHVYSRKVEYLYSLVYAALDNIISSSSNKRSSSKRFDAEIEEFQAFDPHVQFLLLDDVMPTDENNHKINLAETDYDDEEEMPSTTRLSLGGTAATLTVMDKSTAAATVTFLQSGELCILSQGTDANSQGLFYMRGTAQPSPTQSLYSSFGAADPSDINLSTKMDVQPSLADNDGGFANFDDGDDDDGPGFDIAEMNTGEPVNESAPPSTVPKAKPRIKPNPWEMLDPHSASESNGRALRIGTTYRLPPGIDLPPSQCVTGASTRVETHYHPPEPSVEPYCSIATNAYHALLKGEDLPESASANQKLIFGHEFEYLAKAHAKRLAAERRERRLLAQNNPAVVPAEEAEELFGYNDGGFGDYDGDDDDAYAPPFDGPVISPSQVDSSNPDDAAFEALCRAHIQAFSRGAEKYRVETNLTQRVGDWQSKLAPILEEEAQRPEFDIHLYGQHVIQSIQDQVAKVSKELHPPKCQQVEFHSLTRSKEKYEVCRLFLASLSLSNSGNVIFANAQEGTVMTPDTLHLRLLNATVDRPMETYLAPSAVEGK